MRVFQRLLSYLSSLFKRSFRAHGTVSVSDFGRAEEFYKQFGFRRVMSSRGDEVVLLRNHRGDELNLVRHGMKSSTVEFQVERLSDVEALVELDPESGRDGLGSSVRFRDPDGNYIEFYEVKEKRSRPKKSVYHIATREELSSGLTEHYYMPPTADRRFVYSSVDSSLVDIALAQMDANNTIIVEMDERQLSFRSEFDDDTDRIGTYPDVNSPIPREALLRASEAAQPRRFVPIPDILAVG